jgi:GR25 family glycosyltransferase involved in LPS biosynthesis
VYFNYFESKTEKRNKEIQYCLNKLISNKKIDKIFLVCSDEYSEKLDKKIVKINMINLQPTFRDMFNIINFNTKNSDLNILLNSDCYFDGDNIELILNNIKFGTVYCLSTWNIVSLVPFKSEHFDVEFSQSAWAFLGEINDLNCDFKMGTPSCDNVLAHEFEKNGYEVLNPSKDIKVYHYHLSEKNYDYQEIEKNRLKEPYKFVPNSSLPKVVSKPNNGNGKSILNKFVDCSWVINLERRKDRLEHITKEFDKFNITFKRFDAIDGKKMGEDVRSSQVACLRSHVGVIKESLKNGYDRIAIFEDDIIFCDDFEKRFEYYAAAVPSDWDIMYLGGAHFNQGLEMKPFINKVNGVYGAFAMILNNKSGLFQKIIELTESESEPIDEYYCKMLGDFNIYIFSPFFVKTINTVSDISENKKPFSYELVNKYFKNIVNFLDYKSPEYQKFKPRLRIKNNALDRFVDNVYCINLPKRKDKLNHIVDQFSRIKLGSYQIINGIDGQKLKVEGNDQRKCEIGCLRSHISILQDAIEKEYNKIAIFEDDVIFCDDFESRFEYYMNTVPEDWEIMYLGSDIPPLLTPIVQVRFMIYRVWRSTGCFAMILNNKNGLFQKIIDACKKEEKPIDVYIESLFPKIYAYVFLPFFVKLLDTRSDITTKDMNYTILNSRFKETVQLPDIPKKKIDILPVEQPATKSPKEICEEYMKNNVPFVISFNGNMVFDSSVTSGDNISFLNEHFEVYGRPFSYRGSFIKRK